MVTASQWREGPSLPSQSSSTGIAIAGSDRFRGHPWAFKIRLKNPLVGSALGSVEVFGTLVLVIGAGPSGWSPTDHIFITFPLNRL